MQLGRSPPAPPPAWRSARNIQACIIIALVLIAWINFFYLSSTPVDELSSAGSSSKLSRGGLWGTTTYTAPPLSSDSPTLRFSVCNGFTNQRLSIVYGFLYAKFTNRVVVLPDLISDGTQMTTETVTATPDNQLPFSVMYDVRTIVEQLQEFKIKAITPAQAPPLQQYTKITLKSLGPNPVQGLQSRAAVRHVSIDCPLFTILPFHMDVPRELEVIWGVLEGLHPSETAFNYQKRVLQAVRQLGKSQRYNLLHLRVEADWKAHCARWEHMNDGIVRDNCYNNTDTIQAYLKLVGIMPGPVPLYVASYWDGVDAAGMQVLQQIKAAGYKVITQQQVAGRVKGMKGWPRERLALMEYQLGLAADKFIGNSVSSFSALLLLQRRYMGRWAAYYNLGNIPLTPFLPGIHSLPWVFTYNSWSSGYEHMLKIAVLSAERHASLRPYCMFSGNTSSHIYKWLVSRGVTMINHQPVWREQLVALAESTMEEHLHSSHLFKSADMLVGTFQRVDIAVLQELMQYTYVLYTDSDVYFRQPVRLDDFGYPLPTAVGMTFEFAPGSYPLNAGVMLMNLPYLRQTYKTFLDFILHDQHGLQFGRYGPLDQGAFNQFYEEEIGAYTMDHRMNARPFEPFSPTTAVLHWHGPKPTQYLDYLKTGDCGYFYWMCEKAVISSLCPYLTEWSQYLDQVHHEEVEAGDGTPGPSSAPHNATQQLLAACKWLDVQPAADTWMDGQAPTPTMLQLHAKKWAPPA